MDSKNRKQNQTRFFFKFKFLFVFEEIIELKKTDGSVDLNHQWITG